MWSRSRMPELTGDARETWTKVLKADHPRRIDLIIDYFGERREAAGRAAAVGPRIGGPWRAVPVS